MKKLLFVIVKAVIWLISILPFWLLYTFSTVIYWAIFYVFSYRKKVVLSNIKMAFPEVSDVKAKQIRKAFYKHFCDFILENIKSYSITAKEVKKRFVYTNLSILDPLYQQGKSVLLWCGHYASWEWASILTDRIDHKGYGVYKPMDNKRYDALVKRIRERFGGTIISNKQIAKTLFRDAKEQTYSITLMLSDQTPRPVVARHWDNFMGVEVPVFVGGEILANKLKLVNMYLHIEKPKRGHYLATIVPLDTKGIDNKYPVTRSFLNALEGQIKEKPEFYLWTHRRWKHRKTD